MQVLPIRQVVEPFEKFLLLSFGMQTLSIALLVVQITPCCVDDLKEDKYAIRREQCSDSCEISWRLRWQEEMWARDVARAVESGC